MGANLLLPGPLKSQATEIYRNQNSNFLRILFSHQGIRRTLLFAGLAGFFFFLVGAKVAAGIFGVLAGLTFARKVFVPVVIQNRKFDSEIIEAQWQAIGQLRDNYFRDFESEIRKSQFTVGLESVTEIAVEQLRQVKSKSADFEKLLNIKLNPGEMTYARYIEVSNRTFDLLVSNLERIKALLLAARNLNPEMLFDKLKKVQSESVSEQQLWEKKKIQFEEQVSLIQKELTACEVILNGWNGLLLAVSAMTTDKSKENLDQLMTELSDLANRAHKY